MCLLAQYAPDGRLRADLPVYVAALARAGFSVRVAMSGATRVHEDDRARLARSGATAIARPNGGLDFGAWRALIDAGAAADADEVLLANDSVIGPFAPLAPILDDMAGFDAWGMVMSREGRPHLQSWFVWMTGAAFRHAAVVRTLGQDFTGMSKAEIVVRGELGLGAAFEAAGLDVGARHVSRFSARPADWIASNPMHFRGHRLLADGTVPFVKIELLRDNPARVPGVRRFADTADRLCREGRIAASLRDAVRALSAGDGLVPTPPGRSLRRDLAALAMTTEGSRVAADLTRRALRPRRGPPA